MQQGRHLGGGGWILVSVTTAISSCKEPQPAPVKSLSPQPGSLHPASLIGTPETVASSSHKRISQTARQSTAWGDGTFLILSVALS